MDFNNIYSQIINFYKALTKRQKYIVIGTIVAVIVFISFLIAYRSGEQSGDDGYRVLFDNVSKTDAALIVQQLETEEIPYKLVNENTIKIPKDLVYSQRIKLASNGIPKTSTRVGFELFDKKEFGETEFDQNVKYLRALEGELSKTIESLEPIASATVKLAIPKDTVFVSEQVPPSASVAIVLKEDMILNHKQIRGIKNLIAASVAKLTPDKVTIINQDGEPLGEDSKAALADETAKNQMKYKSDFEKALENKIIMLLSPVVGGKNKVVAKVTADFDFTEQSTTEEKFDPNNVVRSEQEMEEKREGSKPKEVGGIPGAVSNIGPVEGLGDDGKEKYEKTEATRNYEISKTVSNTKREFAILKRVSAAILVDGQYEEKITDDGIREFIYKKLEPAQITQIENAVKQAIGFNAARNDGVSVSNIQFNGNITKIGKQTPMEQYLKILEPFLPYMKYIFVIIILYIFYKLVILPFVAKMTEIKSEDEEEGEAVLRLSEIEDDENELNKLNEMRARIERELGANGAYTEEMIKVEMMFQRLKEQIEKTPEESAAMIESLLVEDVEQKQKARGLQ